MQLKLPSLKLYSITFTVFKESKDLNNLKTLGPNFGKSGLEK